MDFIIDGFFQAIILLIKRDSETFSAIRATLQASSISMCVSLILGMPCGFLLGYTRFPGQKAVRTLVNTLLSLPTVFIGLMVYAFLTRQGPLGECNLLFTLTGIAIGQTILALPIVIALVATAVESVDPNLKLTLISLGANRKQILVTTLKEVRFSIIAASMTAYGRVMTEVGISMMIGGNIKWHTRTITTAIALETNQGDFAKGIALGLVLMLIALLTNHMVSFLREKS
ncbi:ABC transporter permease [Candidatus Magnetomorum sp. HK-1]|nr:ABC transporter permease [Candidatus Magnetomorum sp. HK-1]